MRALRALGVDPASITRLLAARATVADTLALQLEAVELRLRTLQRQRAVLRAALRTLVRRAREGGDPGDRLEPVSPLPRG